MKSITSVATLKTKLKKNTLLTADGFKYYLSDFHHTPVSSRVVDSIFRENLLENAPGVARWFEKGYKLRKPVFTKTFNTNNGRVKIDIYCIVNRRTYIKDGETIVLMPILFFFFLKKKKFTAQTFEQILMELDYQAAKYKFQSLDK